MHKLLFAAGAMLSIGLTTPVVAASLFAWQSNLQTNLDEPGLVVGNTSFSPIGEFTLSQGESLWLSMGRVWTDETSVGLDDRERSIAFAELFIQYGVFPDDEIFYEPWGGFTWGENDDFGERGRYEWAMPIREWSFAGGEGILRMHVFAGTFNGSQVGLVPGFDNGSDVMVNIMLVKDPNFAVVPEPATWAMLIMGMGVVGATMRRKHRRQTACAIA